MEKLLLSLLSISIFFSCQKEMSLNPPNDAKNNYVHLIKKIIISQDTSTLVYDDLKRLASWKYYDHYYEAYNVMNYTYSGTSPYQKQVITKQGPVINSKADCTFDSNGRITSRVEQNGVKEYYSYSNDVVIKTSVESDYKTIDSLLLNKDQNVYKEIIWKFDKNVPLQHRTREDVYDNEILNPIRYLWNYNPDAMFFSKNVSISSKQKVDIYQDAYFFRSWEEKFDSKYKLDEKGRVIQIETIDDEAPEITKIEYY